MANGNNEEEQGPQFEQLPAPKIDPTELESKLQEDVASAEGRVKAFAEGAGVTGGEAEGTEVFGFKPRALRIKGKLVGQEEMKQIDQSFQDVAKELGRVSGIANAQERGLFEADKMKQFNKFREKLMQDGLLLEQQLMQNKLNTQESLAMVQNITGIAKAAGFAIAMTGDDDGKKKKGKTN